MVKGFRFVLIKPVALLLIVQAGTSLEVARCPEEANSAPLWQVF
jgi:hypothetical protein